MGFFRRSGSEIGRVIASAADPAAEVGRSLFYSKTVAGIVQLFTRASGGVISQLTPLVTTFDDSVAGTYSNIRGNRAANQSAIDNTKAGITNLGSENGGGPGATKQYATIGGGLNNDATGDYSTVIGGLACGATGNRSIAGGDGATASGSGSVALGAATADGPDSVALGSAFVTAAGVRGFAANQALTSGDDAAAFGLANATGDASFAAGDTNASGPYGVTFGNGATCVGEAGFASGQGSDANGQASVCMGDGGIADGYASASFNTGYAVGDYSCALNVAKTDAAEGCFAHGVRGYATRFGQHSFGSGAFTAGASGYGEAQTSALVFRGSTPGAGISESTELKFGGYSGSGSTQFILVDTKAYDIKVTAVIGGTQAGPVRKSRTIEIKFNARRDGGTTVITASGTGDAYGDAATATWTLVPTVGAAPDRIVLTFDTGVGAASACKIAAKVEFTEVKF